MFQRPFSFMKAPRSRAGRPSVFVAVLLAALAALFLLSGCGGDSSDTDPAGDGVSADGSIEVSFIDGQISGGSRRTVDLGSEITIEVTADVTDEVHLHGYDVTEPVGEGSPATIALTTDIPGDFEVELEDRGQPLFELRVQ